MPQLGCAVFAVLIDENFCVTSVRVNIPEV